MEHNSSLSKSKPQVDKINTGSSSTQKGTSEYTKANIRHDAKELKIQELKREIKSVNVQLEKTKHEVAEENMEAFRILCEKYSRLKDEYNQLL